MELRPVAISFAMPAAERRARVWAALPVKALALAKQRLSPELPPELRAALAAAMLEDVLDAVKGSSLIEGVLVVTSDRSVSALAKAKGATVLERGAESMDAAASAAGAHLRNRGVEVMLLLHSDLPGLRGHDLDALLRSHFAARAEARNGEAMTIAPSHDFQGSNAIAVSPPHALPTAYGPDSFRRHLAIAERLGLRTGQVERHGFAYDLDRSADIAPLLAFMPRGARSRALLEAASGLLQGGPTLNLKED